MPPTRCLPPGTLILLALIGLLLMEPALANKFETISGGVNGSFRIKRDWLQGFLMVVGGIALLLAILSVIVPHKNPLFVNFNTWKQSAAIMLVVSMLFFGGSALI